MINAKRKSDIPKALSLGEGWVVRLRQSLTDSDEVRPPSVNEEKPAGSYEVEFNINSDGGQNLSSGVYFYQLRISSTETSSPNWQSGQGIIQTKKMVLLK